LALYGAFGLKKPAALNGPQFLDGSVSDGVAIGSRKLPYTPDYTASTGVDLSFPLTSSGLELFGRADLAWLGQYLYDASNAQGQAGYALADFRLGVLLVGGAALAWFGP
jgi:hypothetical protein